MTVIKDGTGTDLLAEVDSENRLRTVAITSTRAAHITSTHGLGFRVISTTTIQAATEKTVIVLINNSNRQIIIDRAIASIQGESGKPVTIRFYLGTKTYTSGGIAVTPINLNQTSNNTIDVTAVGNNPTLGGSDNDITLRYMEATGDVARDYEGKVLIGKTGSFRITCEGFAGALGTFNCTAAIEYYGTTTII